MFLVCFLLVFSKSIGKILLSPLIMECMVTPLIYVNIYIGAEEAYSKTAGPTHASFNIIHCIFYEVGEMNRNIFFDILRLGPTDCSEATAL